MRFSALSVFLLWNVTVTNHQTLYAAMDKQRLSCTIKMGFSPYMGKILMPNPYLEQLRFARPKEM